MRAIVLTLGLTTIFSGLLTGCEVESPEGPAPEEQTASDEKPIYGGSPDTTHDAVVLLLSQAGAGCTGTIIAKNGSTGYVLTAGHCENMDYVIMDDDTSCLNNNTCDGVWEVNLQQVHPSYNPNDVGAGYDFSMIRFSGANASTPVIPAATPSDGVSVGTMTDMVGYGLTENGQTDLRMHVMQPVDQLDTFFLVYDQTGGVGTCSGDSGGPALFNGKVVGVTSFGDEGCNEIGVSGRVTKVYNEFIAPFIGGQVTETCDTCFDAEVVSPSGTCAPEVNACFTPETSQCAQLVDCFNGCSTQSCYDGCAADHPNGIAPYNAIIDCYCTACADLCQDECGTSTTTTTTATAASSSTGSEMMGTGGATAGGGEGSGAASSDGGSGGGGNEDGDEGASGPCDCATVGSSERAPQGGALGLAGLALAVVAVRRRRR